jgi:2-amino-4-hydroxy-6-hydroxymethyldihydropteridine diphosphokinase
MLTKRVFLALGSNLGDRERNLQGVVELLQAQSISIKSCSSLYETEPQDVNDQPWFLNMAIECETSFFPLQLLTILQQIERSLGRTRTGSVPRGPRLIDIDILLFGKTRLTTPELTIPHPRMLRRRFVLEPLLEIAPDVRYPGTGERLSKRLAGLRGQTVKRIGLLAACSGK